MEPESEVKILWRRLFSDCFVGVKKLLFCVLFAGVPCLIMFILVLVSSVAYATPGQLAASTSKKKKKKKKK